jgi:EAL domain-containing protein (putative c-di-GMP-specific phosphodiesterase class I)
LLAVMERSSTLRGSDPERVKLVVAPSTKPGAGGSSLEAEIRDDGFRVLFQPIVSLRGDSTEHYEVQVRHVANGVPANVWLAERGYTESSQDLDRWVVIESLKKLALHFETHPYTRLLVPVGVQSLRDTEFAPWLALALRAAGLSAEVLVVQVSHRDVSANLGDARHLAERLRALGSRLCVSEVHLANNPMADLAHLKPHLVRLDSTLGEALKDAESTNTLLKPLIESMHQEDIASIMPEVEGAGMLAVLWQLGINYIQGNYLQTPQPEMRYDFTDLA